MKKVIITSIILTLTLSVNAQSWWNSKKIRGNGNVITETRTTTTYDEIHLEGSFNVLLVSGKEGKLTIEGEENIIPYLTTKVKNGRLILDFKKNTNISTRKAFTITVPVKEVDLISLSGSGNINTSTRLKSTNLKLILGGSGNIKAAVETNSLKTRISGSGNIKVSGTSNELDCLISGSGNINAYDLETNETEAKITGSGHIKTTVKTKINATILGSGFIHYKGHPKYVHSNSLGSGDVIDKN